ncbi:hypothetical protein OXX69_009683 [Metschnikowia pulcherrima]
MSVAFRKEELHSLAKEENVILYVEFPVEFEHGEQFIWSKTRKIDSENLEGWGHDMKKTKLAATPTARKDGSPWTPRDQWVKLQEEKGKAREINQGVSDASLQFVTAES